MDQKHLPQNALDRENVSFGICVKLKKSVEIVIVIMSSFRIEELCNSYVKSTQFGNK